MNRKWRHHRKSSYRKWHHRHHRKKKGQSKKEAYSTKLWDSDKIISLSIKFSPFSFYSIILFLLLLLFKFRSYKIVLLLMHHKKTWLKIVLNLTVWSFPAKIILSSFELDHFCMPTVIKRCEQKKTLMFLKAEIMSLLCCKENVFDF
jgi:hypothetical protein